MQKQFARWWLLCRRVKRPGHNATFSPAFQQSQPLLLAPGRHHVSIRLDGYESVDVDLAIDAGRAMTYRTSLKKRD
jgi:hypothetical protein